MIRRAPETFSYAAPGDAFAKRVIIRLIECMTGQPRLKRIYQAYRDQPASSDFWNAAVQRLKLKLDYDAGPLESWPRRGPLVVVCNHPFGVVDGLAICALVARLRPDFRILANALLGRADEVQGHLLPVDFAGSREALAVNLRSRALARDHLAAGGCLIVFPAGGVSTTPSLLHRRAVDAPWGAFTAKLIAQSRADVAPVYFAGQNSRLFQIASHIHMTLRLSLLFKEAHDRIGGTVAMTPGRVHKFAELSGFQGPALMDHLRRITYALADPAPER